MKFSKIPGTDGMYTVTDGDDVLGTVARVGYGRDWAAYLPGEKREGPRWSFRCREDATAALVEYRATGDRTTVAP